MKKACIVCDACILINLALVDSLRLLGKLKGYQFKVAQAAADELRRSKPREGLELALQKGWIQAVSLNSEAEDDFYAELRVEFGEGESASLALAQSRTWLLATDESGALMPEITARLGPGRQVTTAWILLQAIQEGHISVDEADGYKRLLESHHFRMDFGSFQDI